MLINFSSMVTGTATAIVMAIAIPVRALEVTISPTNSQLGDTISVEIKTEEPKTPPTVIWEQKSFPVFPTASGYRAFVPTSPLNHSGKTLLQVKGDGVTQNLGIWLKKRSFPVQRIWLSDEASRPATQSELDKVSAFKALKTPEKFWQGKFVRPNAGAITTGFGVRRYYNGEFAADYYHKGVDYAGGYGSPVVAPAAGMIKLIGKENEDFHVHGNTIGIDHGQGVVSILMHLQDIYVREGDKVQAGQKIGTVGSSGASTGPHLHWGLYVNEVSVDPVPWRFSEIN
jgi:murein DD-endopeptidase MepM/ murein hydrolase activator NlpD